MSRGGWLAAKSQLRPRPRTLSVDRPPCRCAVRGMSSLVIIQGCAAPVRELPSGPPPRGSLGGGLQRVPQPQRLGALAFRSWDAGAVPSDGRAPGTSMPRLSYDQERQQGRALDRLLQLPQG